VLALKVQLASLLLEMDQSLFECQVFIPNFAALFFADLDFVLLSLILAGDVLYKLLDALRQGAVALGSGLIPDFEALFAEAVDLAEGAIVDLV
jgi:hypothetical protein